MSLCLREAKPADEPFLRALSASVRGAMFAGLPEAQAESLLDLQWRARERHYRGDFPGAVWLVVELDGERVGEIVLDRDEHFRIVDISIVPAMRGRGIGERVLRAVMEEAAQAGKPVELAVAPDNPARRLYDRLGFQVVAQTATHCEMRLEPSR